MEPIRSSDSEPSVYSGEKMWIWPTPFSTRINDSWAGPHSPLFPYINIFTRNPMFMLCIQEAIRFLEYFIHRRYTFPRPNDSFNINFRLSKSSPRSWGATYRCTCTVRYWACRYSRRRPRVASSCYLCTFVATFAHPRNILYVRGMLCPTYTTSATDPWKSSKITWW